DLILATHGRGIWIVDDITPLRALTPDLLTQEATFVSARPVQQRIEGSGGWANGDAAFVGDNPPDAAVITYYQRSRHLFGKLKVGLDRRAKFSEADRKAQFDAAMKAHALFGDESALMDRILGLRKALAQGGAALPEGDQLRKNISDFDGKVDAVRKKIVATTEGGVITGEERLREHTDQLYGAHLSDEEKPGAYLIAYVDALKRE